MKPLTLLLWFSLWLSCVGVNASCPSLNINYPARRTLLCPGDSITYTCVLNSPYYIAHMRWTGSAFQCTPAGFTPNAITLSQSAGQSPNPAVVSCGNLSAVMTNVSGTCYTSVLTMPTPQYYNGTTVQCKDATDGTVSGSDTLDIQLASSPNNLVITRLSRSTSSTCGTANLTMAWGHDARGVATTYLISINVTGYGTVTVNSTSMISYTYTFTNLSSSHVYMVTLMATNCVGSLIVSRTEVGDDGLLLPTLLTSTKTTPIPASTITTMADMTSPSGSYPAISILTVETCTPAAGFSVCTVNNSLIGIPAGIAISVSFVVLFLGVLVASVLCYILRRSKESCKPRSQVDCSKVYDEVDINRTMKGDVIEISTNTAYGIHM